MTTKSSPKGNTQVASGVFAASRRFFTESRQYFLTFGAAIASFGGIRLAVEKIGMPRWVSWLALVPPLLVFFFETAPRLWRTRRERMLIRRSVQADATPLLATEPLGG